MKLVVGLGNPGQKYAHSRHNLGFIFANYFARSKSLIFSPSSKFSADLAQNGKILIVKPTNFMNNSGSTVKNLIDFYKVNMNDLYLVHDDLDLKLGDYKIQKATGPKDHHGVQSVEASLGSLDFWRLRLGIDNRSPENRIFGEDYVLQSFSDSEQILLNNLLPQIAKHLNEALSI